MIYIPALNNPIHNTQCEKINSHPPYLVHVAGFLIFTIHDRVMSYQDDEETRWWDSKLQPWMGTSSRPENRTVNGQKVSGMKHNSCPVLVWGSLGGLRLRQLLLLHSRKLTWHGPWEWMASWKLFSSTNQSCSGSMLVFSGVSSSEQYQDYIREPPAVGPDDTTRVQILEHVIMSFLRNLWSFYPDSWTHW